MSFLSEVSDQFCGHGAQLEEAKFLAVGDS